jgi:phospholipase/carboxylesterase
MGWLLIGWINFYKLQSIPLINAGMNTLSTDQPVLIYRVREPRIKASTKKAIILLHGVGSNENDLFSLADQLPDDLYVITPRGPFTLSAGRFAWYNVDFSSGKPVYDTSQEVMSRARIQQFIADVKKIYQLDAVYLGGFSQGAIMSYSIGLTQPQTVQGIIALGGRILDEIKPGVKPGGTLQKLNVFIAHGTQDGTLPIGYARAAKSYLDELQMPISYHEYAMGHEINEAVLRDLNTWLALR